MEESAEYAVGDRYSRRTQKGAGAEPGDSAATADESTTVLLMSDLMISLRDVFASATAGDRIAFEYTITNDGPSDTTGVTVSEVLADGLHLLPSGADPSDCSVSGREVTCRIGNLASGESRLLSVTLVLDPSALGNLVNTATVSRAEAEFDKSNNTVSSTISVTPLADLELKRTDLLGSNSNHPEHEDD